MVRKEVAATASSAHGAHHGHDSFFVSCGVAMPVKALPHRRCSVEQIPHKGSPKAPQRVMVNFLLMLIW